jgi:hypothetical protein
MIVVSTYTLGFTSAAYLRFGLIPLRRHCFVTFHGSVFCR